MKMKLMMAAMLTMVMCGSALAQTTFETRGSAIMPGAYNMYSDSTSYSEVRIWVTNISGSEVTCRVTPYDHDGVSYSEQCTVQSGSRTSAAGQTIATNEFTLPAGATRIVRIYKNSRQLIFGHINIEWSSEDTKIRKALVATGVCNRKIPSGNYANSITINGGEAF